MPKAGFNFIYKRPPNKFICNAISRCLQMFSKLIFMRSCFNIYADIKCFGVFFNFFR